MCDWKGRGGIYRVGRGSDVILCTMPFEIVIEHQTNNAASSEMLLSLRPERSLLAFPCLQLGALVRLALKLKHPQAVACWQSLLAISDQEP